MKVLLLATVILQFLLVTPGVSQMPGHWESKLLCEHCPKPVGMDFEKQTGVVVLETQYGYKPYQRTTIFVTHDRANSWKANLDSLYEIRVLQGDFVDLNKGHLLLNCWWGATVHSEDYGDSLLVIRRAPVPADLDFISPSSSTFFRAVRRSTDSDGEIDIYVSRDSGNTFSILSSIEFDAYNITSLRFRDTSEYWIRLQGRYDQGEPIKRTRLIFTRDQGKNWTEVYPLDTTGTSGRYTTFGFGTVYNTYDGITPGQNPGSLYLLSNWYKTNTPESKHFSLLLTTDWGTTWKVDSTHLKTKEPRADVELIRNSGGSELWMVRGNKQTLSYSADNGTTWVDDSATFKENPIAQMLWTDSVSGYVLTHTMDSTLILWKYVEGHSAVQHFEKNTSSYFQLPVAVIGDTHFKIRVLKPLSGQLTMSDILGRPIWSRPILASESESVEVDLPVSRGVYFLSYSQGPVRQTVTFIRQ